jgi:hypothetical protein
MLLSNYVCGQELLTCCNIDVYLDRRELVVFWNTTVTESNHRDARWQRCRS